MAAQSTRDEDHCCPLLTLKTKRNLHAVFVACSISSPIKFKKKNQWIIFSKRLSMASRSHCRWLGYKIIYVGNICKGDTNAPSSGQYSYIAAFLSVFRIVALGVGFFKHGKVPLQKAVNILASCVTVSISKARATYPISRQKFNLYSFPFNSTQWDAFFSSTCHCNRRLRPREPNLTDSRQFSDWG
jgi:hypothetical protein